MQISVEEGLQQLQNSGKLFVELFQHGTLVLEIFRPIDTDQQTPHERDEVYIVISGSGDFLCGDRIYPFQPGHFLFVPAGIEHRFLNFSDDFVTWVIFYGPKGGENRIESF